MWGFAASDCCGCLAIARRDVSRNGAEPPTIVSILDLDDQGRLPKDAAFSAPPDSRSRDVNPGVSWSAGLAGTRSYALLLIDPDSPNNPAVVNERGVVIPSTSTRVRVFHWVMADIPTKAGGAKPLDRTLPSLIGKDLSQIG